MITLITMIIETQIYDNHLVRRLMISARTWCTEVARLLVNLCHFYYQYIRMVWIGCWSYGVIAINILILLVIIVIFIFIIAITIARIIIMIILLNIDLIRT